MALVYLQSQLGRLLAASISENTKSLYSSALNNFYRVRNTVRLDQLWPVPIEHVLLFICHHAQVGSAPSTVSSYLSAVSYVHKLQNWQDPTACFIVRKAIEGLRRLKGSVDTRAPITYDILSLIHGKLSDICFSVYEKLLFRAVFCLAFFGLFRVGELVYTSAKMAHRPLLMSDCQIKRDLKEIIIVLRQSKTDQSGRSVTVVIPCIKDNKVCPVYNMHAFLKVRACHSGYLFLHQNGLPLTRYQFGAVLQKCVVSLGLPLAHFKSHSFRIGGATTLAMKGVPTETIKRLGRWKSHAFKTYIRL